MTQLSQFLGKGSSPIQQLQLPLQSQGLIQRFQYVVAQKWIHIMMKDGHTI